MRNQLWAKHMLHRHVVISPALPLFHHLVIPGHKAIVFLQTDPEAAKIVFESGAPIVMLPIELTHTALVTPDVLDRISAELVDNTPFVQLVKQLLLYFAESYKTVFKFDNPPLHDPCAVAYVIAPAMFPVSFLFHSDFSPTCSSACRVKVFRLAASRTHTCMAISQQSICGTVCPTSSARPIH